MKTLVDLTHTITRELITLDKYSFTDPRLIHSIVRDTLTKVNRYVEYATKIDNEAKKEV